MNVTAQAFGVDDVAQALADPIRRDILRMLRDSAMTAGTLAGAFEVSRPAVSRHLRVLREAGLVRDTLNGRERLYHLDVAALVPLQGFLRELHETAAATWERRFMALETEVYRVRQTRKRAAPIADEANKSATTGRPTKSARSGPPTKLTTTEPTKKKESA